MRITRTSTHRLTAALLVALAATCATNLNAQQTSAQDQGTSDNKTDSKKDNDLGKVVVTGSLIPQTAKETFKPVTTITSESVEARGFTSVTEALQQSAQSTGGTQGQGSDFSSFTKGAETMSLFGLNPGYTKYLIDGRPMANYPALYNGTDVFNNIDGIPTDLVDRVEILPGGQSSLYGSDAIAGVVNFILKKKLDAPIMRVRYGDYQHGGGQSWRASFANGFTAFNNKLHGLYGVQVETVQPIWSYQRDITKQFFTDGHTWTKDVNGVYQKVYSPPTASRDWMIFSGFTGNYVFADPNNCANVSAGFGGTEGLRTRPGRVGEYCGSYDSPGYRTLKNGKRSAQLYSHLTFDLSNNAQIYTDLLYSRQTVRYHDGSSYLWWGSSLKWGYYYDPNLDDLLQLQRAFTPEDMGGDWAFAMSKDRSDAFTGTVGINGTFGGSNWDYDASFTHNQYKLRSTSIDRLNDPINNWFQNNVLGPQQGLDPYYGVYPVFTPNYAKFYTLMTPGEFMSFMGATQSKARTYDNMFRAQITNTSLFHLPGGDAGMAVALEAGNQGWRYDPDPLVLSGGIWGRTDVSGMAARTRASVTGEIRLPVWSMLTISASGRYDRFKDSVSSQSKPTYSIGLEFRPLESLLFRGKYGTAFKVPTLADMFQGTSGFFSTATDYYQCYIRGFDPSNILNCPNRYYSFQYQGSTAGNPKLKPITATTWGSGMVWAPTARFSISADYLHWNIKNEVSGQDVNGLLRDELACRIGQLDPNSGTCQAALSQVTRNAGGTIDSIFVQKVNVASEILDAVTVEANYKQPMGRFGALSGSAAWNKNLKHKLQQYPTDPYQDALNDPYWTSDPKYKANASLTWDISRFSTTLYANHIGPTPNYRANNIAIQDPVTKAVTTGYAVPGAAKLGSFTTFNGSFRVALTKGFSVSLMVNNLTDKKPPHDDTYPGTSSSPYNSYNFSPLGRSYYLEAKWDMGAKK